MERPFLSLLGGETLVSLSRTTISRKTTATETTNCAPNSQCRCCGKGHARLVAPLWLGVSGPPQLRRGFCTTVGDVRAGRPRRTLEHDGPAGRKGREQPPNACHLPPRALKTRRAALRGKARRRALPFVVLIKETELKFCLKISLRRCSKTILILRNVL